MAAPQVDRRTLLRGLGSVAAGLALSNVGVAGSHSDASRKPLRGLFPIGQTPFTESDQLDLDCLAAEVRFCNRARVPDFVWPQIASGWSNLSQQERLSGAEAILSAGKGGKTALAIGVQTNGDDLQGSIAYAKHAASRGADAIISLPPAGDNAAVFAYYKAIGAATDLPLIVQTRGDKMTVDFIVQLYSSIPTMRVIKDEVGDPLERIGEIREKTHDKLAVFAGNGVRTLISEMQLGFSGYCPVVGLSDLYQESVDLYNAGKRREAFDMFGRILAFDSIPHSGEYILVARGIFKETTKSRATPGMGNPSRSKLPPLDEEGKTAIRDALALYLKPYLRA